MPKNSVRGLTALALISASLQVAAKSNEKRGNLRESPRRKIQVKKELSGECLAIISDPSFVGDGYCDIAGGYNTQECNYDGGDCCPQTCVDSIYVCELYHMDCLDPRYNKDIDIQPLYGVSDECSKNITNIFWIGDGYCDKDGGYNTAACNYDGGDCCRETCKTGIYECLSDQMDCIDPYVKHTELSPSFAPSTIPTMSLSRKNDTNLISSYATPVNIFIVSGSMDQYYGDLNMTNLTDFYSSLFTNETQAFNISIDMDQYYAGLILSNSSDVDSSLIMNGTQGFNAPFVMDQYYESPNLSNSSDVDPNMFTNETQAFNTSIDMDQYYKGLILSISSDVNSSLIMNETLALIYNDTQSLLYNETNQPFAATTNISASP